MTLYYKICICLITCITAFIPVKATQLDIEYFRLNNQLPSTSIQCITQDKEGLIWFGTNEWAAWYDGYTLQKLSTAELHNNLSKKIYCLQNDKYDNMWIGTANGAYRYNKKNGLVEQYRPDPDNKLDKSKIIYSIALSPDKQIYLGTRNGVFTYNENKNSLELFPLFAHHKEFNEAIKSERIAKKIYFDKMGLLWIGTEGNGLVMINIKEQSQSHYKFDPNNINSIPSNFIQNIYEDRFGNLWIATSEGFALYKREQDCFVSYQSTGIKRLVTSVVDDGNKSLIIGTDNGIAIYERTKHIVDWLQNNPTNNLNSLLSNNVSTLYKDRSGVIWIGTSNGVCKLSEKGNIYLFKNIPGDEHSLSHNTILFMQADSHRNGIWLGTGAQGIDFFDMDNQIFSHYNLPPINNNLPQSNRNHILTGLLTKEGKLILGTTSALLSFDPQNKTFQTLAFPPEHQPLKEVYALCESSDGNLWISVLDKGLYMYNAKQDKLTHILLKETPEDKPDIFTNIKIIAEDENHDIWMAFHQGGIACYNTQSGKTKFYTQENTHGLLPDNLIWGIQNLNHNRLGIATASGITFFDLKNRKFILDKKINKIINGAVTSILQEKNGKIWLGSERGIFSVLPSPNNDIIRYSEMDGLQGNIFFYQVKAQLGPYLFFGGDNGFNVIDTQKNIKYTYIPIPAITSIRNGNKLFRIQELDSEKNIPLLKLTTEDKDCIINVSNFSYIKEWRNRFQYQIMPYDTTWYWIDFGKNSIKLPALSSGKYTLLLRSSNTEGKWSNEKEVLKIDITSIWTTIALVTLLLIITLLATFYLLNLKYPKFYKKYNKFKNKNTTKTLKTPQPNIILPKLPDNKTRKIIDALISSMENDHIYTNKRLNKAQLATLINLSESQLSQILKEFFGKGFNDFVNYYRVEAVKRKLQAPQYREYTLLGIGDECGFNSKTSFYRVFKEMTGITPTEYIEQINKDRKQE